MHNPLLWLGLSFFLVAVCLVAVLLVAIPVMQELSRTARSAEKLLDMLSRELPPTLQSLRATGDDLSELSGQVNEGVRSASQVVTQVDQGLENVRTQAESVKRGGLSLFAGIRAAWQEWKEPHGEYEEEYYQPAAYESYEENEPDRANKTIEPDSRVQHQSTQAPSPEETGESESTFLSSEKLEISSSTSVAQTSQRTAEEQR